MQPDRRQFLRHMGWLTASGASAATPVLAGEHEGHNAGPADPSGVLVDLTMCVGCRLCEHACKKANGFEPGPVESYDDQSVFNDERRPGTEAFTVVNAYTPDAGKPVYVKTNCMHCNHAACVSACIVGALQKQENGAVTYDAWKCIGCRYCMVACPFQIPTYTYDDSLTPAVRKCEFCITRTNKGEAPACVAACPRQAMTFGKRKALLELAHEDKLKQHPGQYVQHVYGEHEVGGTSWMYVSRVPFEQAGFLTLGNAAPPALTEAIQHGVFKHWIAPVGWYGFLATMMWYTGRRLRLTTGNGAADRTISHTHEDGFDATGEDVAGPAAARSAAGHGESRSLLHLRAEKAGEGWSGGSVALAEAPEAAADLPEADDADPKDDSYQAHDAHGHEDAAPVRRSLLTPGVLALVCMVLTGVGFGLYRFIVGLGASTNLDQQHPWGLWIAMDVGSGIALAGGGFVTAALVHIFHREHYHAVARSALLTALLGYTFYVPGLLADIGRWYNIWHPTIPMMWQGNSVLFEVGLCVMIYLNVQYAELTPILCTRLFGLKRFPRAAKMARLVHDWAEWMMPALLVLGVCLSTFHQSSLGNLMVIAPYKLHRLWWTPVSPLLFLLSAMMVGFPMVIFTLLFASWSLRRKPEIDVLAPLARYVPPLLGAYLAVKVADVIVRNVHGDLFTGSFLAWSWIIEVTLGVAAPMVILSLPGMRRSARGLGAACLMVILGVVLNRLNVFVLAYHPPYSHKSYFPSMTEFAVSMGLVAALLLTYRVAVTFLPILQPQPEVKA